MKVRARRQFVFSCCDLALEVRLSPAIISPVAVVWITPAISGYRCAREDPLPDPEPSPGPYTGNPPAPTSGPIGPGSS